MRHYQISHTAYTGFMFCICLRQQGLRDNTCQAHLGWEIFEQCMRPWQLSLSCRARQHLVKRGRTLSEQHPSFTQAQLPSPPAGAFSPVPSPSTAEISSPMAFMLHTRSVGKNQVSASRVGCQRRHLYL